MPQCFAHFIRLLNDWVQKPCIDEKVVPCALRGMTLGQLAGLHREFVANGYLGHLCAEFNIRNEADIAARRMLEMQENLYALDMFLVKPLTSAEAGARDGLPPELIVAAEIPESRTVPVSFSQLVNADGIEVDFFVSHWWGHDFSKTVEALTLLARERYAALGKATPDHVVYWICLFALNQHRATAEVGSSLELAPFNVALSHSRCGAVMVLDSQSMPLFRIWCLFEVKRSVDLQKDFQLVTEEGPIERKGLAWMKELLIKLQTVSAASAKASIEADLHAIQYSIVDHRHQYPQIEDFVARVARVGSHCQPKMFRDFDTRMASLVATPLLHAAFSQLASSEEVVALCFLAIGMGAEVTVIQLETLAERVGDLSGLVQTRDGNEGLAIVMARFGRVAQLACVLDRGADLAARDNRYSATALHWAASRGHAVVVALLLDRGADFAATNKGGLTALDIAKRQGYSEVSALLMERERTESERAEDRTIS